MFILLFFLLLYFSKMFGISEFASASSQFGAEIRCVLKRLYSDFIVVEIPADGSGVLKPGGTTAQNGDGGTECGDGTTQNAPGVADTEADDQAGTDGQRPKLLTDQHFDQIKGVAEGVTAQCVIDLKEWPKEERKCLYQFVRAEFTGASALETACENSQLKMWRAADGKKGSAPKRSQWPKERGDFLHFTMVKRNIDTQAAIHMIARSARLKPSSLAISGTKDRRAITAQRVSVFRVEARRLESAARSLRGIWLRDFCYANAPLRLGDAFGNRFDVILRDINAAAVVDVAQLGARIAQWERVGFLNYFGPQRFGTCGVDTARIGRLLLAEQWESATAALLAPRAEANDALNKCLRCYAGCAANAPQALRMLETSNASAGAIVERALLSSLAKCTAGHKAAILALRRDMRTMYIHAYQSAVFNDIVTRRKKTFGLTVLEGDLDAEGNVLEKGSAIERVCLPLPSVEDTKMPSNEIAHWYAEIAADHAIHSDQFAKLERQFAVGSVYRPFIVRPANVTWKLLTYASDTEPLQQCEFIPFDNGIKPPLAKCHQNNDGDVVDEGNDAKEQQQHNHLSTSRKALKISFDLPAGTYATVALRELMRTDFGKTAQKELEEEMKTKRREEDNSRRDEEEQKQPAAATADEQEENQAITNGRTDGAMDE